MPKRLPPAGRVYPSYPLAVATSNKTKTIRPGPQNYLKNSGCLSFPYPFYKEIAATYVAAILKIQSKKKKIESLQKIEAAIFLIKILKIN